MGLFNRRPKPIKIPRFEIGLYGKLPCYKDFLSVSCHPAFTALKTKLDSGFDHLIREGIARPYVCPDRRFFFRLREYKVDIVGCIFESSDGKRCFPFILAAVFAKRLAGFPAHHWWQTMERVWAHLEDLTAAFRAEDSRDGIFALLRNRDHKLEPFLPNAPEDLQPLDATDSLPSLPSSGSINLGRSNWLQEQQIIAQFQLDLKEPPGMLLWPGPTWRDQTERDVYAYLGKQGLSDLKTTYFQPGGEKPAAPTT